MKPLSLLILMLLLVVIAISSCATQPLGDPNPLNEPGYTEPTAQELHMKNVQIITGNPAYDLK